jgi:hypothetical protein
MTVKQYFPISVAVFVALGAVAHHFSVPFAPFAAILLTGETLLGFQLEDHKVAKAVKQLFTIGKPHSR